MPHDLTAAEDFARELSFALKAFHRALIQAEIRDDPALRDSPYTALFALIGDPRFAWMGVLSQLITEIDEMLADPEARDLQRIRDLVDTAAQLVGESAGAAANFRMRHVMALQKEPEIGLATGRLRKVLGQRPDGLR